MRELLDRVPAHDDVWALFDRDEATRYAHQAKDAFRAIVDPGRQVVSGILWVLEQPAPPGIQEKRDLPIVV
jgi:hypothetical protein